MPPQYRGHLAVANLEARLQDHRRLPERQSSRLPRRVPPVHVAVRGLNLSDASCWRWTARASRRSTTRTATLRRTRWRSSSRRRTGVWTNICGGLTRAMSRSRDRRLAHQKPRGKHRGAAREARAIRGAAHGTGAERREPDIADRSRQPLILYFTAMPERLSPSQRRMKRPPLFSRPLFVGVGRCLRSLRDCPVRWLMLDQFRSNLAIRDVHVPVLMFTGRRRRHSDKLGQAALRTRQ